MNWRLHSQPIRWLPTPIPNVTRCCRDPEEVAIIDNYLDTTQGNSSDAAWTSAVARVGLIPAHWASSGLRITEFPAPVQDHGHPVLVLPQLMPATIV
ncbi:hypothetical protein Ocin01_17913 [Orchesella cincta]|uniref:Uncharacterized protein n=1 Tax=Orchesella cincta TaxID=48709 RepID=A0A1D2M721_ORCCI|nr:hypothetical protein Ocin01_17913 [Orchesella cincta]